MAESAAETARVQMQSDRARGDPFIVHARPCAFPATVGTRYRWSPPLAGLAPAIHAFPAVVGAAFKNVGGRNKSGQGDLGLYRARYGTADFAQPDSCGSSPGLVS